MRKLLLLLLLLSFPAIADRVDDRREMGKDALCQMWGYFAARGAWAAYHKVPLVYFYVSPKQMEVLSELAEHGNAPKDGMYFKDDGLTEQEKRFWEDASEAGYKRMQAMLRAKPDMIEPDPQAMVPAFFGACMQGPDA